MNGATDTARAAARPFRWLASIGLWQQKTLLALMLAAAATWGFVELADEVIEGETAGIDERLLLAFRDADDPSEPIGPVWVEEMARDFTGLGGHGVLTFLTLASAGFLALQRRPRLALYVIAAVATGVALSMLLKAGFSRPRPDLVPHGQTVYTSSFPSGHSMSSAIAFLTLGTLLAAAQTTALLRGYLIVLALLLTGAVGVTRVYLGVHWPTDVLGGWTAGAAWALLCWAAARRLRRAGLLEPY